MASWQAFAIRTILRFTMKRAGRSGIDIDKTRASFGTPRPQVLKIWPGWSVGPRVVEGLTFEAYDRADLPSLRDDLVVLYLHGGGYFFGSPQMHRQLALNMAKHCDAPVFSLDYRLAPMHRFPAALDDAIAAYQWLVKTYPQRHFIIAGDSAGGGLAINTALEARSHGLPRPAAVITFSPWTDMAVTGESVDSNNRSCAMLTAKGVREAGTAPRARRAARLADLRAHRAGGAREPTAGASVRGADGAARAITSRVMSQKPYILYCWAA